MWHRDRVINQVDTTTFYNQIQADLAEFKTVNEADFTTWVASIKDVLDAETAGNLLNLINEHKADVTAHITAARRSKWNDGATSLYTHSKSGTVHTLTGTGSNVKFKAAAAITDGDTWAVNGTATAATLQNGETLSTDFFKSGNWVTAIYDGTKLNFKSGGGGYGTLSAQINNFYATIGNASVVLTWAAPADSNYSGVMILQRLGAYPSGPRDGTKIYEGAAQAYTDTGLTNGTQYYYRAFAYNAKHENAKPSIALRL